MKLKIASIVAVYPPYGGGLGVVARENAQMLKGEYDITVFSPRYPRIAEKKRYDKGVTVEFLRPFFSYGNAAFLPQLLWRLRAFDCIHLHYPFFGATLVTVFASLLWRKKLVVTYHMDLLGRGFVLRLLFSLANVLAPLLLASANRLLVTTLDYAQASAIARLVARRSLMVSELPNSVNADLFTPSEKDEHDPAVILFVGGLDSAHYFKGVEDLLSACASITDYPYRLVIVGDGDLREFYKERTRVLGINAYVVFRRSLPAHALADEYRRAAMLVLPSRDRSEAFGVVLIEAGACGTAVIASDLPGVRIVIEHGVTGFLVPPGDLMTLAGKISLLLSDPEQARHMGANGLTRVKKMYSNEVVGAKLRSIFKPLTSNLCPRFHEDLHYRKLV